MRAIRRRSRKAEVIGFIAGAAVCTAAGIAADATVLQCLFGGVLLGGVLGLFVVDFSWTDFWDMTGSCG